MEQPKNFFPAFDPTFTVLNFAGILWWQFFLAAAVDEFEVEIDVRIMQYSVISTVLKHQLHSWNINIKQICDWRVLL